MYIKKHKIRNGINDLIIELDFNPTRICLDPYHKIIDRAPQDNEKNIIWTGKFFGIGS